MAASCPTSQGAFLVGSNSCVCPPGYYLSGSSCEEYVIRESGQNYSEYSTYKFIPNFSSTSSLNTNVDTKGQEGFIIFTLVLLGLWLGCTFVLRFMPLRGVYFRLRRYVCLVDYAFSKKHWIDEQKVQVKRKTELGGMLSIGAFVFIIGINLGILYQFAAQKKQTTQSIVPTSGQDVQAYFNDIFYNVTIISGMKCAQWTPSANLYAGTSASSVDRRTVPASSVSNSTCVDTPRGPQINTFCPQCVLSYDEYYLPISFVDLPDQGLVASAVGFEFVVQATGRAKKKTRQSIVSGSTRAGSNGTFAPGATLRGGLPTILTFRFVPRIFKQDNKLKLIQVTFHGFVTGTYYTNTTSLQAALRNTSAGLTVIVDTQVLSAYIVQTQVTNNIGVLTFLSKVGGIYQLGILIFFLTLNSAERYIKFLRYDDKLLNRLEKQRVARYHWNKLRIAVKFGGFLHIHKQTESMGHLPGGDGAALGGGPPKPSFLRSISRSMRGGGGSSHKGSVRGPPPKSPSLGGGTPAEKPLSPVPPPTAPPPPSPPPPAAPAQGAKAAASPAAPEEKKKWGLFGGGRETHAPRPVGRGGAHIEISDSMERQARRELQQEYPDANLPPSELLPGVAEQGEKYAKPLGNALDSVERFGEKIKHGVQKTGNAVKRAIPGLAPARAEGDEEDAGGGDASEEPGGRGAGEPGGGAAAPAKVLKETPSGAGQQPAGQPPAKKPKKKGRDTRLGAQSEHKGSMIRTYRNPSWIPNYEYLPHVPDPEFLHLDEEERRAATERKERRALRARKREEHLARVAAHGRDGAPPPDSSGDSDSEGGGGGGDDEEEEKQDSLRKRDPIDVYNYFVEMHDFQYRLRQDFLAAQSMLENVVQRFRPHSEL